MTQQEISTVPGTDTTVITERTTVQPDGREHVQSRIVWLPSPLSGQSSETRYPEQPARVQADLDEAAKVQVTKGRHAKACRAVKDGTLTPPWYADVPPVGINTPVPLNEAPTATPTTAEWVASLGRLGVDLSRDAVAAMAAGDVARMQQVSADLDALLVLVRHQDQALVLRHATHADLDRAMDLWSEEGPR